MMKCIFISGTDTDVGKTHISSLILKSLADERSLTCGFKPIASGGISSRVVSQTDTDLDDAREVSLTNSDALTLQQYATLDVPYNIVNPFCFEPAIAPHVAAAEAGVRLSVSQLDDALAEVKRAFFTGQRKPVEGDANEFSETALPQAQIILCEGAGGWHVPLNESERLSHWVAGQQMGVILVVGLKLGCINHALLSCEAITQAGVPLLGWVANRPSTEVMSREAETLAYLENAIAAPLIADVPFSSDPQQARFDANAHRALMSAIG